MYKRILTAGLLLGLASTTASAQAVNCAKRDLITERLHSKFSEQLTAGGLQATRRSTSFIEVWASQETGTFTVMLTRPDGVSCIIASGTDFFTKKAVPVVMGTPS